MIFFDILNGVYPRYMGYFFMNFTKKATIAGFAIFSMIFGSGNIVFPLILGKDYTSNYMWVIAGWILSTVVIPIVGYYGAFLFDGDNKKYLSPIGKQGTFILMIILMLIAGPFGVTARGVNVAFGGIHIASPFVNEVLFNFLYCLITILLAWHPGKIVQLIGVIFTPLKFGGVIFVVVFALYLGGSFQDIPVSNIPVSECFMTSTKTGFQTMDLLASFLMGSTVYFYIKNSIPQEEQNNKKLFLKFALFACIVGAIALSIVYIGLTLIGSQYAVLLQGTPNESLFTKIAEVSMGPSASWFVAIVIAVSCLATNIALSSVFTDFIHKDILKERFNRQVLLVITGILTFGCSLLGFDQICRILGIILEALYPFLIIFVFARIVYYFATQKSR